MLGSPAHARWLEAEGDRLLDFASALRDGLPLDVVPTGALLSDAHQPVAKSSLVMGPGED